MAKSEIKELIKKTRAYRRFYQNKGISRTVLRELVDLARLSASGGNVQPLKYYISNTKKQNEIIFPCLAWAGYLKNWEGPEPGEQPAAYIIILGDKKIKAGFGCDHGIAAQSIMLGAVEKGFGGCMLGSVDREELQNRLKIPKQYEILLVLALGKPKEEIRLETVKKMDIKYWRDSKQTHHVPKRKLNDIIIN
jgi:nitroreductase